MKKIILIFLIFPIFCYSQKKDYKSYDKAVKYFYEGNYEKAKTTALKITYKYPEWNKPYLLLASICASQNNIEKAVEFLLNVYDVNNTEDYNGIEQIIELYYNNGYYNEALYYLQKISDIHPKYSEIDSNLILMLSY